MRAHPTSGVATQKVQYASGMADTDAPPMLVRLSIRMHLPVQPQWRPWAMREIERRFGPDPSVEDRDIIIPPFMGTQPGLDAATAAGGRIPRRPMAVRKADDQYVVGLRSDGSSPPRGTPLVEPIALFELVPQRFWPWLPVAVIALITLIIGATVWVGLALM